MPRLLHILPDTDFRCRHDGLRARMALEKIKNPRPGDIYAFFNRKRDRLMCLAFIEEDDCRGIIGYYRSPHGRVPPEAMEYIAEAFGGGGFDMNQAIRKGIMKLLAKKGKRK